MRQQRKLEVNLPHPDSLRRPSSTQEAEQMLELGMKMLSMSLQWAESERCLSSLEVEALQGLVSTILAKVKVGDTRLSSLGIMLISCRPKRGRDYQGGCHHLHQVNESAIFSYIYDVNNSRKRDSSTFEVTVPHKKEEEDVALLLSWLFGNIKKARHGRCTN